MKNKNIIAIDVILFVVFNVIAFVVPTELSKSFWITYIFTIITFAIQLYMWLAFFEKNPNATSRFYRIPVLTVCYRYFGIQLISFLVFKFIPSIPSWVAIVANVIILAVALIGFITLSSAADYIASVDAKVRPKVSYIKSLQVEVESIINDVQNNDAKIILSELAEKIRFSDPMSDASLYEIEENISYNVQRLKSTNAENMIPLAKDTIRLLDERNKKCKILK